MVSACFGVFSRMGDAQLGGGGGAEPPTRANYGNFDFFRHRSRPSIPAVVRSYACVPA